jgi:putative SOS response-associated peptidase YedK
MVGEIMCGRITISVSKEELKDYLYRYFRIEDFDIEYSLPRYNVAPGQMLVAVINDGQKNRVGLLKWGFIPHFSKDEKSGQMLINARAETVSEKPAYKDAFRKRRCLILADSYFEWQKKDNNKIPMRIMVKDSPIFTFAGLWSVFTREDGSKIGTCAIITTTASNEVAFIHDRMPVIIQAAKQNIWLGESDPQALSQILLPFPEDGLISYPVSKIVNSPKNNLPECIVPLK